MQTYQWLKCKGIRDRKECGLTYLDVDWLPWRVMGYCSASCCPEDQRHWVRK